MLWRLFYTCRIEEYLHGGDAWAVVTGSTDGIGKCLADDLLSRGFNVLIHGRSQDKVNRVHAELTTKHPDRHIESVLADLTRLEDVQHIISATANKHVTIFINNAAPTDREYHLFRDMPPEQMDRSIAVGVSFLTHLVHDILPILEENGPSILINIGSQSANTATPYVSVYSAVKGYMLSFTRCLAMESRMTKSRVEIMYSDVHSVNSATNKVVPNIISPSSEVAARAILNVVGCGYTFVTPYWAHEFAAYWTLILPQFLLDKFAFMSVTAIRTATENWNQQQSSTQINNLKLHQD